MPRLLACPLVRAGTAAQNAQRPAEVFRGQVDLVTMDVSATDARGRRVEDLRGIGDGYGHQSVERHVFLRNALSVSAASGGESRTAPPPGGRQPREQRRPVVRRWPGSRARLR